MIAYCKTIFVVFEEVCALVCACIASKIFCGDVSRGFFDTGPKTVLSEYHFRKHESYFLKIISEYTALLGCQTKDLYSLA
jgi:hypothetical protein